MWQLLLISSQRRKIIIVFYFVGKYGMAIMTYFKFIRWLLFLNIYLSIVMLLFVIIPGSFMLPYRFEQSLSFKNMTDYKTTTMCSRRYQLYIDNFTKKLSVVDKILDFLEGTVSYFLVLILDFKFVNCNIGSSTWSEITPCAPFPHSSTKR